MSILPINQSILIFPVAGFMIVFAGISIIKHAERIAKVTGMGQAMVGAVFIGATTSLSGLITSIFVASQNQASMAVSNSLGGIAIQTVSLSLADLAYRKANLEHAAASETNLVQGVLLIILLAIPLAAATSQDVAFFSISPFTPLLIVVYILGIRLASKSFNEPMWQPKLTNATCIEDKGEVVEVQGSMWVNGFYLLVYGFMLSVAGWLLGQAGISLNEQLQLDASLIGGLFTAITTSLPELVVAIAAVRQGALNLAVGNIIGGNTFDILFIGFADIAYRKGSIYADLRSVDLFWIALNLILTSVLLLGLLRREKYGIANIGFESVLVIMIYLGALVFMFN